jgi:enediyne biosynthesis protein E4
VLMVQLQHDFGANGWTELKCETSASVWIENLGNGKFKAHELPVEAQFAPINSIIANDVDDDGSIDLIIAGNEYQASVNIGRYDASYGLVLKGNGKADFKTVNNITSGLIIDGDVKDMKIISIKNKAKVLLAAPNDDKLKIFLFNSYNKKQRA